MSYGCSLKNFLNNFFGNDEYKKQNAKALNIYGELPRQKYSELKIQSNICKSTFNKLSIDICEGNITPADLEEKLVGIQSVFSSGGLLNELSPKTYLRELMKLNNSAKLVMNKDCILVISRIYKNFESDKHSHFDIWKISQKV